MLMFYSSYFPFRSNPFMLIGLVAELMVLTKLLHSTTN